MLRRSKPEDGESLAELLAELPEELRAQALTHASWVEHRSESYERLAFLGDVVLSLAVSTHLFPRFERYGAGRLTKVRAQAVSGASCARVAVALGVPDLLSEAAPEGEGRSASLLVDSERVLASVCEAIIGAAYLAFGLERTSAAVVRSFAEEIDESLEHPVDYKSVLQERLARRAEVVAYRIDAEQGPAHDRSFVAVAEVSGQELGRGEGKTKKGAEQEAALQALEALGELRRADAPALDHDEGLQVLPEPHPARLRPRGVGDRGPQRLGQVERDRRRALGARRAEPAGGARADDEGRDLRRRPRHQGLELRRGRGGHRQRATGELDCEFSEIAIQRRLGRDGEGEYRLNGARCRLVDVLEVLSDSGLGKEMHSVVSQGRVEAIVLSRPRERRLLIEEAAGLGKHRKRRRRAQLKLERTQENLDRALDVEREARSRLRPLKRQAEAAELHGRLERQTLEARMELARDDVRAMRLELGAAESKAAAARSQRDEAERPAGRRGASAARPPRTPSPAQGLARERLQGRAVRRALGRRAHRHAPGARPRPGRCRDRAGAGAAAASSSCWSERPRRGREEADGERIAELEGELAELDTSASSASAGELAGLEQRARGGRARGARELEQAAASAARALEEADASGRALARRTQRGRPRGRVRPAAAAATRRLGARRCQPVRPRSRRRASGDARPLAEGLNVEPATSSRLPPPWARGSRPAWSRTSRRASGCWTRPASAAAARWCRPRPRVQRGRRAFAGRRAR